MSNDAQEKETLESRIELVRSVVRDEREYLEEATEITDNLHEIADSCVPVYHKDIADVFASAPDLGHGPEELYQDPEANIFSQIQTAIYEKLYAAAVEEADELGLLD